MLTKEQRHKRREARRNGIVLCTLCFENEKREGKSWCKRCAKLYKEIKDERRKKGRDWDGSPVKLTHVSIAALVRERLSQ